MSLEASEFAELYREVSVRDKFALRQLRRKIGFLRASGSAARSLIYVTRPGWAASWQTAVADTAKRQGWDVLATAEVP